MKVADFDFDLPSEFIAQRPAAPRDSARLLAVADGLGDFAMRDLPGLLAPGDLMVFNDTRVIPARLDGRRGQARIETTLIRQVAADTWNALVRPARRLHLGDAIDFGNGLAARVEAKGEAGQVTLLFNRAGADLMAALEATGAMPLPPYIKRDGPADARDRADYQTMFARRDGAVAAPTAALHFTPALVAGLAGRGIGTAFLTLHVGAGTFLPVKVDDVADHKMHAEWGEVTAETAAAVNAARKAGGRIVAVGTTSMRLLETAAAADGTLAPFSGETDIFITPGYRFKVADMMLTNFHLPRSTLFMLVCAFAGTARMRAAYAHAKAAGYRFYSYGDGCLLTREGGR
ncbi:tRNA preQ1(34) S-adenosylmethionine ribosyltransferase-isomerase QueA [Shumkonia mesophila]|uniref:tRNA preQ1(34) S-adenosylmethionine ribosyltransferase-isomerase QueA n=1 Tax=Shumkonia mesophila TaxID=2838854 RepID=UPI0029352D25|nr:tRNA preQ1(34) S-adenosylmethionine ribosyltransferase-isomerase QueA [Shumkonia mesophila]